MNLLKQTRFLLPVAMAGLLSTGCAQFMAMGQPKPFTPTSLTVGAKRTAIIGELGSPRSTEEHNSQLSETYHYVDGGAKNSGGAKFGRVLVYTAGDIFTAWLDQIIWMPAEKFGFAGTEHVVTVNYTKPDDGFWQAATIDDKALGKGNAKNSEPVSMRPVVKP